MAMGTYLFICKVAGLPEHIIKMVVDLTNTPVNCPVCQFLGREGKSTSSSQILLLLQSVSYLFKFNV
jgi:hypothetical protein